MTGPTRVTGAILGLVTTTLPACFAPTFTGSAWHAETVELLTADVDATADAAATHLLAERATPTSSPRIRPGDAVLFALDVDVPSRQTRRSWLRFVVQPLPDDGQIEVAQLRVTSSFEDGHEHERVVGTRILPVSIEVFADEAAAEAPPEPMSTSVANAWIDVLVAGWADECTAFSERIDDAPVDRDEFLANQGPPVTFAVGELLQNDPVLHGLAMDLVDPLLVTTVLWNFRLALSIHTDTFAAQPEPWPAAPELAAYHLPVQLSVNERPALQAMAHIVEPRGPLGLCAGIVAAAGFRANDPRYRFRLRLVGWRSGADR